MNLCPDSHRLKEEINRIGKEQKWPKMISWKTLVKYLRDMVKGHILEEYPRGHRKNNESLYRLSDYTLYLCLDYLFWHQRFQSHGRMGKTICVTSYQRTAYTTSPKREDKAIPSRFAKDKFSVRILIRRLCQHPLLADVYESKGKV